MVGIRRLRLFVPVAGLFLMTSASLYAEEGYAPWWVYNRDWAHDKAFSPDVTMGDELMGVSCENGLELIPDGDEYFLRSKTQERILGGLTCPKIETSENDKLEFACTNAAGRSQVKFKVSTRVIDGGEAGDQTVPATVVEYGNNKVVTYCVHDIFQANLSPKRIEKSLKLTCRLADSSKKSCIRSATFEIKTMTSPFFKDRLEEVKNLVILSGKGKFQLKSLKNLNAREQEFSVELNSSTRGRVPSSLIVPYVRDRNGSRFEFDKNGISLATNFKNTGYLHLQKSHRDAKNKYWFNYVAGDPVNDNYAKICELEPYAGDDAFLSCDVE